MLIKKVVSNNVVFARNKEGKDIVVTGLGIGFGKKREEPIDEKKIEKIFVLPSETNKDRLSQLLSEIPIHYLYLTEQIVRFAENNLKGKLNRNIYITLTDHIYFAVKRLEQGISFNNQLLWEIRRFYPEEYAVSLKALKIIEQCIHVAFPQDEASFIALHIVDAEMGGEHEENEAMSMTKIIKDILNIVKYEYTISYDEDSLSYTRFILHLKFFAQKLLTNQQETAEVGFMRSMVQEKLPKAFHCTMKIKEYIGQIYGYTLSESEEVYLTVHIDRVTKDAKH